MILEIEFSNKRATGKYYKAMGTYDTEKNELTILKDSVWAKNCSNNEIEKTRQDLINNGFVDKGSNTFKKKLYLHNKTGKWFGYTNNERFTNNLRNTAWC